MDLTKRIRDKMMKERLMFVYRGVVTNENSVPLSDASRKGDGKFRIWIFRKKRLFMFVLESLQNVSSIVNQNQYADMSLVVYSKKDNGYTVTTGNVLPAAI